MGTAKIAFALTVLAAAPAAADSDAKVTTGSPEDQFPRNAEHEPALAVDPSNPLVVAAGVNDYIDQPRCVTPTCNASASAPGVGAQGIYFSFDGAATWIQPTYSGWSARTGTAGTGPIGTVPNYYEHGLVSLGDPAVAFGPRPGANGFDWANGSRLYYSTIAFNFPGVTTFSGSTAVTVSFADDLARAAGGDNSAWSAPVIVDKQDPEVLSDRDMIWVDNAASSPFFGNVYVCNNADRASQSKESPEAIVMARSTDGGATWTQKQISRASDANNVNDTRLRSPQGNGRLECQIRTDSRGVVYVFWLAAHDFLPVFVMARSFDGGTSWRPAVPVATFAPCGQFDPVSAGPTFDGVAGSRMATFVSVDIANGAPAGTFASDALVLAWCDAAAGTDHEQALVQASADGGETWSAPVNAAAPGDRPGMPAVAISPAGDDVYVVYDAFLQPWQATTTSPRLVQGVVMHAEIGADVIGPWSEVHRAVAGDARGTARFFVRGQSPLNTGSREFMYDYIQAAATPAGVYASWMDERNAEDCPAIDAWRQSLATPTPLPQPVISTDCPAGFGNQDVFAGFYAAPTP